MTDTQPFSDLQSLPYLSKEYCVSNNSENSNLALIQMINKLNIEILYDVRIAMTAHKLASRFWSCLDLWINIPNTTLAAISGTSALSSPNGITTNSIAGVCAICVAVLTSMNIFLKPSQRAENHLKFAAKYSSIYNKIDSFTAPRAILDSDSREVCRLLHQGLEQDDNFNTGIYAFFRECIDEKNQLDIQAPLYPSRVVENARKLAGKYSGGTKKKHTGYKNLSEDELQKV